MTYGVLRDVTVDRIALLIPRLQRKQATDAVTSLHALWNFGQAQTKSPKPYLHQSHIPLGGSYLFAELGSTHREAYLKFDWQPPEFGQEEWGLFQQLLLNRFGMSYADLLHAGRVTYIEIAADYEGVDSGELFVFHRTLRSGTRWPVGETTYPMHYVGHKAHSKWQYAVYARAQRIDKRSREALTRIETRYRGLQFTGEALLQSPLLLPDAQTELLICDRAGARYLARIRPWLGTDFLRTEESHGAQHALYAIRDSKRRFFVMDIMRSARCGWWNSDDVRRAIPAAVTRALTPPT